MPWPNFSLKLPFCLLWGVYLGVSQKQGEHWRRLPESRQNGDLGQAGGGGDGVSCPGRYGVWEGVSLAWPEGGRVSVAEEALPLRLTAPPLTGVQDQCSGPLGPASSQRQWTAPSRGAEATSLTSALP